MELLRNHEFEEFPASLFQFSALSIGNSETDDLHLLFMSQEAVLLG